MKTHKFLAANSLLLGTIIIFSGFVLMFLQLQVLPESNWEIMAAFFYTISGIIFWAIGFKLNPNASFFPSRKKREVSEVPKA